MRKPICLLVALIACCLALAGVAGPKITNIVVSFEDGSQQRVDLPAPAPVPMTQPSTAPTTQRIDKPFLGVNLEALRDYDRQFMFIDAMKTSRKFGSATKPFDQSATLGPDGWPTGDAGTL